ncbi:hypothetical protein [Micromonospora inositola]|uniref:hypothetical protein n=1 Tax=Micromonospora inositola TaxID=47865 RepID=UPI00155FA35D|nr:hypothetical protein [Micromonospora inositola]
MAIVIGSPFAGREVEADISGPACGPGLSSDCDARSEQLPCSLGDFGDDDLGVIRVGDDPNLK